MVIMLVSDIHLSEKQPAITDSFLYFLYFIAVEAKKLYIIGDLFDFWIGDDYPNPLLKKIAIAFQTLTKRGVKCYFIHGNRDLLLGSSYASICNITILPYIQVLPIFGYKVVILHGDILCTKDKNYKFFRKLINNLWIKSLFLKLPLSVRLFIANTTLSILANNNKIKSIIYVDDQEVINILEKTEATIMIHGHTHLPAIHKIIKDTSKQYRIVLGSWDINKSIIKITPSGIVLCSIS